MERLTPMRFGILFALLTLVYGFGLGAAFGAAEDRIKDHLNKQAQAVLADKYGGDEAKAQKVASNAWTYLKRAHLHANGLGTASLALILLLSFVAAGPGAKGIAALLLGLGSLGYSLYWMLAGLRAPGMGSTGAAKESLQWLAVPSSGMCIVGLLLTLVLFARCAWKRSG